MVVCVQLFARRVRKQGPGLAAGAKFGTREVIGRSVAFLSSSLYGLHVQDVCLWRPQDT